MYSDDNDDNDNDSKSHNCTACWLRCQVSWRWGDEDLSSVHIPAWEDWECGWRKLLRSILMSCGQCNFRCSLPRAVASRWRISPKLTPGPGGIVMSREGYQLSVFSSCTVKLRNSPGYLTRSTPLNVVGSLQLISSSVVTVPFRSLREGQEEPSDRHYLELGSTVQGQFWLEDQQPRPGGPGLGVVRDPRLLC